MIIYNLQWYLSFLLSLNYNFNTKHLLTWVNLYSFFKTKNIEIA
jgi:hypothetical protein